MNKLLKEPLLHFMVLGILIYLTSIFFQSSSENKQKILISAGKVKHLATLYQKTWQRPANKQQLQETINEYALEQAAYLEGISLGLDKNDIVITRRVRQKLDFIAEEYNKRPVMTDVLLQQFLNENADDFRLEPQISIKQVFLDPPKHNENLSTTIDQLLTQLTNDPEQNIEQLGERYVFRPQYKNVELSELTRLLGRDFSQSVNKLSVGKWHGPIRSSFGLHLVLVEEKVSGALPQLEQVKSLVIREWEHKQREQSIKRFYDELLMRYPVTINWPDSETSVMNN